MYKSPIRSILKAIIVVLLSIQAGGPAFSSALASPGQAVQEESMFDDPQYIEAIQRTEAMTFDETAIRLAAAHGLDIINVAWEDTGRYKGSSVGPNISDVTIQVMYQQGGREDYQLSLMPVIRYPNFSDLSADIAPDQFFLLVGNEKGQALHKISLRQFLENPRQYLHDPSSWPGRLDTLLAERDTHVLVSAQAAFLPVPQQGLAEFNPVIFNYQSMKGDPAVLTIVATREGSSVTVIDNTRDAFPAGPTWGQRLFFNQDGQRASFTGQRLSDFQAGQEQAAGEVVELPEAAQESGLNMVLVIQVPLKQKNPMTSIAELDTWYFIAAPKAMAVRSDVELAVIGHGKVEGPFTEIDGLEIERDPDFPIRVTVQFYKATSNGVVNEADIAEIAAQIQRVYQQADYAGSLVTGGETERPTEYEGPKQQPAGWWEAFWQRYEQNSGMTRQAALELWRKLKITAGRWFGPR